jgi:hypothetical protein
MSIEVPWPMFRHDPQHTGRSKYRGAQKDVLKWKFQAEGMILSSPAVGSDGTVYASASYYLYAVNPDGTLK